MVTSVHYIITTRWSSPWPPLTLKTNTAFLALLPLPHHHPPHAFLTIACGLSLLCRSALPSSEEPSTQFSYCDVVYTHICTPFSIPSWGRLVHACVLSTKRSWMGWAGLRDYREHTPSPQGSCAQPSPPHPTLQMHFPVGNKRPETQLPSFLGIWPWMEEGAPGRGGGREASLGRRILLHAEVWAGTTQAS